MEEYFNNINKYNNYADIEVYKEQIDSVILDLLSKKERLVFAVIAERAGVTRFVIRHYPELRDFILDRMKYHKEIHIISEKIEKAAKNLNKCNKSVTFLAIAKRCNFDLNDIYKNEFIKGKIINVLAQYKK